MSKVMEYTVMLVKPDGVKRQLTGEIIKRVEQTGLRLVAAKLVHADKEKILKHLPCTEEWRTKMGEKTIENFESYGMDVKTKLGTDDPSKIGMEIQEWLTEYLTSGPVMAMAFYGLHAIKIIRKIVGHTLPNMAEMGTIRGDFAIDSSTLANVEKRAIMNLVHASGDPEEAENELKVWFNENEIINPEVFN